MDKMMKNGSKTEKVTIYLASPFFSDTQVDRVKRVEKALEFNPFVENFFSPRQNQLDEFVFGSKEWRQAVFAQDIKYLENADVVVAVADMDTTIDYHYFDEKKSELLQGTKNELVDTDSGTAFEIGYAYARGIPIVVVHETDKPINLMVSDSLHAYFKNTLELTTYNFMEMPESSYDGEVI